VSANNDAVNGFVRLQVNVLRTEAERCFSEAEQVEKLDPAKAARLRAAGRRLAHSAERVLFTDRYGW
jgi:hypothetical protein